MNSALMHAKLQEDAYHTASHPGVMIVPAALATAETLGSSGRDLLTALVAGYEVETAITADFIPRSNEQGFRSSPIYGPFGAAIAVGKLLGLDEDQLTHAIGFAATFAAGTFEGGDGTDVMVLQVSQAPRSGLLAAQLAAQGARAADTSLEGTIGFYDSFIGSNEGLEHLADHLGERWEILEVTLKRYPDIDVQPAADSDDAGPHAGPRYPARPDRVARIEMNDFETSYPGAKFARRLRAPTGGLAQRRLWWRQHASIAASLFPRIGPRAGHRRLRESIACLHMRRHWSCPSESPSLARPARHRLARW